MVNDHDTLRTSHRSDRVGNIVIQFDKSSTDISRFQFCYEITIHMHLGTFFKLKFFEELF